MLSLTEAHSPCFSCVPCWDVNISGMICCHLHWCFQESSRWEVSEQLLRCILMQECFSLGLCGGQREISRSLLQVPDSGWALWDTGITCSQCGSPQSCGSWSLLFVLWPFPADWHWSFMHRIDGLLWLTFWEDWIWRQKEFPFSPFKQCPPFPKLACTTRSDQTRF